MNVNFSLNIFLVTVQYLMVIFTRVGASTVTPQWREAFAAGSGGSMRPMFGVSGNLEIRASTFHSSKIGSHVDKVLL